jgi:hypothetical protein
MKIRHIALLALIALPAFAGTTVKRGPGRDSTCNLSGTANEVGYLSGAGSASTIANFETDGTNPLMVPVTSHPTIDASRVKIYTYRQGTSEPAVPFWLPSVPNVPISGTPIGLGSLGPWKCAMPQGFSGTTVSSYGFPAPATVGTLAAGTWGTGSLRARMPRHMFTTTAAINSSGGLSFANDDMWVGSGAGTGGFVVYNKFAIETGAGSSRLFVGVKDSATAPANNADPNAELDSLYFGCNTTDTNISACGNDNTGTASCTTNFGASFPCSAGLYEGWIYVDPNAATFGYTLNRLDGTPATTSGTFPAGATNQPRNTVAVTPHVWLNTGSGAGALILNWMQTCEAQQF